MHQLYCITDNVQTNITPLVGNISWSSDVSQLGDRLNFSIAFNDSRFFPEIPVEVGSSIVLKNKDEIFRGIVVTSSQNGRGSISYTCLDYAFYLNKSKEIYQFNKISAKSALETIFGDFGISIGRVASIDTVINKIYNNKVIAQIIKDILTTAENESGIKYTMEMRQNKIYIEKQEDLVIKATFKLSKDAQEMDVSKSISNPVRNITIENMKNSVKILIDENKQIEKKDSKLIGKYGLLQEVIVAKNEEDSKAKNIAEKVLKDLGKVMEDNTLSMIGNDAVRAGRLMEIQEPVTGMSGKYLIKNVKHTLKNGIHLMQLGLGVK
ncbi:hypothetical protein PV797_05435 [Clostridiaceae bacterium M8S5]|nr:hypothetical protein PV797_05435 [Clostridiaceae bacterium M8S5]